jgi:hypothetical protein
MLPQRCAYAGGSLRHGRRQPQAQQVMAALALALGPKLEGRAARQQAVVMHDYHVAGLQTAMVIINAASFLPTPACGAKPPLAKHRIHSPQSSGGRRVGAEEMQWIQIVSCISLRTSASFVPLR